MYMYKAQKIQNQIDALYTELRNHQEKCKHVRREYKHRGNTGNYDPSEDCYWTDFYCPTCLKRWREDGSVGHKYKEMSR